MIVAVMAIVVDLKQGHVGSHNLPATTRGRHACQCPSHRHHACSIKFHMLHSLDRSTRDNGNQILPFPSPEHSASLSGPKSNPKPFNDPGKNNAESRMLNVKR